MSWYDIEQLDSKTFIISENKHYEETNIYYLIGERFNVCIDTGMGLHKIRQVLEEVDSKEIRVITTHSHWDHIGNHREFNTIYLSEKAKFLLGKGGFTTLSKVKNELIKDIDEKDIPPYFNLEDFSLYDGKNGVVVNDGEIIDLGNRKLEIIKTPGHTEDSISIFEKSRGYLFLGDLLYSGRLYCNSNINSPSGYYDSLKKLMKKENEITKVFSGHYNPEVGKITLINAFKLFEQIKENGKLHHGTGTHEYRWLEVTL